MKKARGGGSSKVGRVGNVKQSRFPTADEQLAEFIRAITIAADKGDDGVGDDNSRSSTEESREIVVDSSLPEGVGVSRQPVSEEASTNSEDSSEQGSNDDTSGDENHDGRGSGSFANEKRRLHYVPPPNHGRIILKDEDCSLVWQFSLVGYSSGRFPGLQALREVCGSWGVDFTIHTHASGWIVFRLKSEDDLFKVLGRGPYRVRGKYLILKRLPRDFQFGDDQLGPLPIWIRLPSLPLEYWNVRQVSAIVSAVGTPMLVSASRGRASHVRVLANVDLSKPLVQEVRIHTTRGGFLQSVEFEHVPSFCAVCRRFGHLDGAPCLSIST